MSGLRKIYAGSKRKARKTARLSGSGMRTPGDTLAQDKRPLPELPQKDGSRRKRRRSAFCLLLRLQRKAQFF